MVRFKRISMDHTFGNEIDIPEYDTLPPDGILKKVIDIILKSHGLERVT